MTPKEKAKELVSKFIHLTKQTTGVNGTIYNSKQCALIAVEFAMNSPYSFKPMEGCWISGKMYYEEVKQEIEKL